MNLIKMRSLVMAAVTLVILLFSNGAQAQEPVPTEPPPDTLVASGVLAVTRVISYQGRLVDPSTQVAKPDGNYAMSFRLYTVASGGSAVWTENQTVAVTRGAFNVLLGSATPFNMAIFSGQDLYLGVTVASDPEMSPRLRMGWVAYAFYADNANALDGRDSTSFANTAHNHAGSTINSGAVGQAFIDSAVARDAEVMPIVLAADGPGSGLDADSVDGWDSTSLWKGSPGTQYTGVLNVGATDNVFTFGWSSSALIHWWAVPTTATGMVRLVVDLERGSDGNITYWLRVTNVGPVQTGYQLVRYVFFQ